MSAARPSAWHRCGATVKPWPSAVLRLAGHGGRQVTAAFAALGQQLLAGPATRRRLEALFGVCDPTTNPLDSLDNQNEFTQDLAGLFGVQENDPSCTDPYCNIDKVGLAWQGGACQAALTPATSPSHAASTDVRGHAQQRRRVPAGAAGRRGGHLARPHVSQRVARHHAGGAHQHHPGRGRRPHLVPCSRWGVGVAWVFAGG